MIGTIVCVCSLLQLAACGYAPTWDTCNCSWETWAPWSSCTETCGGGRQVRTRSVWNYDIPSCDGFEACATVDMGYERRLCNKICYHGGKFQILGTLVGICNCLTGNKGSCCEQVVNCGTPSMVTNGRFSGTDFTYASEIYYTCDVDFNMTNPSDAVRTCTEDGYWTGRSPSCIYVASCKSCPCNNDGTCTNTLGGYICACHPGWTGKHCDLDIQPPVFDACPTSKIIQTSNTTHLEVWTEPSFTDPFGGGVFVTKNYETSKFIFAWGHHTVQYTGTKTSNGLSTDCVFTIDVQPHPCKLFKTPAHGIVVCNDWRTIYSSICKLLCQKGYTYPPGFSDDDWYVCAASGHWFPASNLVECVPQELHVTGTTPSMFECENGTKQDSVGDFYVQRLKASNFNNLCEQHLTECHKRNVYVNC